MTTTQNKQMDYLNKMEMRETMGSPYTFHSECKDCGTTRTHHSCEGARCFIKLHEGHRTWIETAGRVHSLTARG